MEKHIAIYLRVSSSQQSLKSQIPDLKRWVKSQDEEYKIYKDKFTGKSMDRPGWNRLCKAMEAGTVEKIVCWRLDRLGRTAKGLTALFTDLNERNIALVSLKDGIDLSTAAGRMMANVLASVAQFETEIRAERVLAGQAEAKAKGKTWGGSKPGVRKKVSKTQIRAIRRMKEHGESVTAIAKAVSLSRGTVYSVLETAA